MVSENHNVEVVEWNGQVLFNPKHVGDCLGINKANSEFERVKARIFLVLGISKWVTLIKRWRKWSKH